MRRTIVFVTVAILTFLLGLATFHAVLTVASLEDRFVIWSRLAPQIAPISTSPASISTPPTIDEQAETNAVYQAVVQHVFISNREIHLVFEGRTTGCHFYENREHGAVSEPNSDFVEEVQKMMPNAESGTVEDYFVKNRNPEDLRIANLGVEYQLISAYDVEQMFSEDGGWWSCFYKRYPHSNGLTYLSRVGFNLQHDQALVYLGNSCGGLCGAGSYLLLRKYGTVWLVEQRVGLWVS